MCASSTTNPTRPPNVSFFCSLTGVGLIYISMFVFYLCVWCLINKRFLWGSVLYSLALSIKMNILLFAPGFAFVYYRSLGLGYSIFYGLVCLFLQVVLALPFLMVNPTGYWQRAFELGRVFLYKWTVNWRMLDESIFLSFEFHIFLLVAQLVLLLVLLRQWSRPLGWVKVLQTGFKGYAPHSLEPQGI